MGVNRVIYSVRIMHKIKFFCNYTLAMEEVGIVNTRENEISGISLLFFIGFHFIEHIWA